MAYFAAPVSGSWDCAFWLTFTLSWFTGTLESNGAIVSVISNIWVSQHCGELTRECGAGVANQRGESSLGTTAGQGGNGRL